MSQEIILKMEGITKNFSGIKALDGVDFELYKGGGTRSDGGNGAGKSTLMKCLGGIYVIDEGQVYLDGKETEIKDVKDALAYGISIIHQELVLNEQLTVADNIYGKRTEK